MSLESDKDSILSYVLNRVSDQQVFLYRTPSNIGDNIQTLRKEQNENN